MAGGRCSAETDGLVEVRGTCVVELSRCCSTDVEESTSRAIGWRQCWLTDISERVEASI